MITGVTVVSRPQEPTKLSCNVGGVSFLVAVFTQADALQFESNSHPHHRRLNRIREE